MQPRTLTILTGASRGLGAAIAEQLLHGGAVLLTMSRHPDKRSTQRRETLPQSLEQWSVDLADGISVRHRLEAWLKAARILLFRDVDQQRRACRKGGTDR